MASKNGLIVGELEGVGFNENYIFDRKDGLSSNVVYDFLIEKNELLLATGDGLVVLKNEFPESVVSMDDSSFTHKVYMGDRILVPDTQESFSPNLNDLLVEFKLLDFQSKGNVIYEYQLSPIDESWNSTKQLEVKYNELPSANYTLRLKATDAFGNSYVTSKDYKFTIRLAFWKSPWLFIALFSIGSLFVYFLVKRRERFYNEEMKKEKAVNSKIAELQMESLRSQMNPHFIFNALGSIQYYIQTHKIDEADLYLTKFAHLMRQYLESAIENMIVLDNEIKLLRDYLDLEIMRFEFLFKYEIRVSDDVSIQSIKIPSMLLQPFVENAINHGLQLRKDGKGKVSIDFKLNRNGHLICEIVDNGVGRENAEKYSSKLHVSRGMSNILKRVEVLKSTEVCDLKILITPVTNDKEFPGTKVFIEFNNLNINL